MIKTAVEAGELDAQIEQAAGLLKEGFTKWRNTYCGYASAKLKPQIQLCTQKDNIKLSN